LLYLGMQNAVDITRKNGCACKLKLQSIKLQSIIKFQIKKTCATLLI